MNASAENRAGYSFEISSRENSHPGWHQELELVFVLRGRGTLWREDRTVPYSLHEADLFTVSGYEMHEIHMESGGLTLSLLLSSSFLSFYFPEAQQLAFACKSYAADAEEQKKYDILRADFAAAFQTFYQNEAHHAALHLRSKLILLLDDLIRYFSCPAPKAAPAFDKGRSHLRAAAGWIDQHYTEDITLKETADRVYLSESYLSRLFKRTLGLTFTEYLTQVRLDYAALLLRSGQRVTETASKAGFRSTNSFIQAFKQTYQKTPGQYKRELGERLKRELYTEPQGAENKFSVLSRYLQTPSASEQSKPAEVRDECAVSANLSMPLRTLRHSWRQLINVGYAHDLLNGSVQKQVRQVQAEIGFRYARVKGILDDDVLFYAAADGQEPVCHFAYADEAIDFLLSVGLTPFLELGAMPSQLAKNQFTVFKRQSILSTPKDMRQWTALLTVLLRHFQCRYGVRRVEQWIFTPCFNPFFYDVHADHLEEYFSFYRESYRAVRALLPHALLCGPGDLSFPEFLERCLAENCVPDCIAAHAFFTASPDETDAKQVQLLNSEETFPLAVTGDEDYLKHLLERIRQTLRKRGLADVPVMLDEWNSSFWQRDLCNDTCAKSASLFKNILENYDAYCAMGYWTVSDFMEELSPSQDLFHGGFGLFTRNGLAKSGYRALQLLCKAGEKLLARQEGCFITSSPGEVQVFLYNAAYYDLLYRFRHTAHLTLTKRYGVFNKRNPQCFQIGLNGLQPGRYLLRRYAVGRTGGSVFDAWVEMGAPERVTEEVRRFLESRSYPVLQMETVETGPSFPLQEVLQPYEIRLITLTLQE